VCVCVCVSVCVAKSEVEGRLGSARLSLSLQDEALHQNDREHRQMLDRLSSMERTISCVEADKRQLQVQHGLLTCLLACLLTYSVSQSVSYLLTCLLTYYTLLQAARSFVDSSNFSVNRFLNSLMSSHHALRGLPLPRVPSTIPLTMHFSKFLSPFLLMSARYVPGGMWSRSRSLGLKTVLRHTNVSSRTKCSTSRSRLGLGTKGLGVSSRISGYFVSSRRFVQARAVLSISSPAAYALSL